MPKRTDEALKLERVQVRMTQDVAARLAHEASLVGMTRYQLASYALTVGLSAIEQARLYAMGQVTVDEAAGNLGASLPRDLAEFDEADAPDRADLE